MSKKIKKAITISAIIILIIVATISTFFILKYFNNKNKIDNVCEIFAEDKVQERLENENTSNDELLPRIDGEIVLGVIKIEKIGFEGLIFDGTSLDVLEKGVGHFRQSSYSDGNVCLAAHNTKQYWAKLHTLRKGDKITYVSFLGTRDYEVTNVIKIRENDWSYIENTEENLLTLITCVKGEPSQRLCVQALEVK